MIIVLFDSFRKGYVYFNVCFLLGGYKYILWLSFWLLLVTLFDIVV